LHACIVDAVDTAIVGQGLARVDDELETRCDDNATPAHWRQAVRVDVGRLAKAERVAGGGVRVEGAVARVGIYTYRRADGSTTRELLPAEEAGRLESLRSLRDATVTVGHPAGGSRLVSNETWKQDAVGHVSGEPRSDGKHVVVDLVVQDAPTIARIDAGELVELSPGYALMIDPTPGTWNGERYDAVQRMRRYNHVALLPKGHARGGSEASLRIDGVDVALVVRGETAPSPTTTPPAIPPSAEITRVDTVEHERIDGIDYKVGSPEWRQAKANQLAKLEAERQRLDARVQELTAEVAKQTTRADVAEKRVKELTAELEPARIDARVAERTALITKVRPVLGDVKLDGKSELEIMTLALAKLAPDFKVDAIDESQRPVWIRARFEAELKHVAQPSPLERARVDALHVPTPTTGAPGPAGLPPGTDLSRYRPRPGRF
jgi:hypothetical protein